MTPYWLSGVNFAVRAACEGIMAQEKCHVDVQQSSNSSVSDSSDPHAERSVGRGWFAAHFSILQHHHSIVPVNELRESFNESDIAYVQRSTGSRASEASRPISQLTMFHAMYDPVTKQTGGYRCK